jgi:four helix bundle protein
MTVKRFEDLVAWQKARALAGAIYSVTRQNPLAGDRGLSTQMQKSAVSVMSNIAEGFERGSPAEFHRFLFTAKASCAEVRSQIYVAYDVGYLDRPEFARLLKQTEEVGRILGGLRVSVARQRTRSQ